MRIAQALASLDERYRTVVLLFYYEDLSYEKIGEVLHLPKKTVETLLYRARKKDPYTF